MNRARAALGAALVALPQLASAHLEQTGLGPFYDGVAHFVGSPEDVLQVVAVALLAGLNGAVAGRCALFALTGAWAVGGICGFLIAAIPPPALATKLLLLATGAMVALNVGLRPAATCVVAGIVGLVHGWENGSGIAAAGREPLAIAGISTGVFVVVALGAALVVTLRVAAARIAVRVAGSWLAAVGLLMLGWAIKGR